MASLFRKYRPQRFSEVAEQEHVVRTLTQQIKQASLAQVYLFSGPRGVGKTTIARLLAKALQCTQRAEDSAEACGVCSACAYAQEGKMMDTVEIDAASQTGVDAVRENIIEGVRFGPSLGKYKVFIIDEVHMLSTASFNALLKTLEEPPKYAVFILATTELHKIPATVLSRCQRFAFTRIPVPAMVARLQSIAREEQRRVNDGVLHRIARLSEGCLRDAESLLGQVFDSVQGEVTEDLAKSVLPDSSLALLNVLIEHLAQGNESEAAREVRRASEGGASLRHVHDDFLEYVQAVVFACWGDDPSRTYDEATARIMKSAAERMGAERAVALLDELLSARLRQAPALLPELPLQVAFFKWGEAKSQKEKMSEDPDEEKSPESVPDDRRGLKSVSDERKGLKPVPSEEKSFEPVPDERRGLGSVPDDRRALEPVPDAKHAPRVIEEKSLELAPHPLPPKPSEREESIRGKWGRCLEKAKEAGPGYALMVGSAQFAGMENDLTLLVEFPYQMHADRMQDPKNAKILLDAIKEICLLPPETTLKASRAKRTEEAQEEVADLLAAFGGEVV